MTAILRTMTRILPANEANILEAASLLRMARWWRFRPRPSTASAPMLWMTAPVAKIFAAKERPAFNPLIVHVRDREEADETGDVQPARFRLAERSGPAP
jgi:L-threonylcarbamoyladenylate synthase